METIRVYEVQYAYARGNGNVFKFQITQKQQSRKQWTHSWNTKQAKIIENIKNACTYTTTTTNSFQCSCFFLSLSLGYDFFSSMYVCRMDVVLCDFKAYIAYVHWNIHSLFLLPMVFTLSFFIVLLLRVSTTQRIFVIHSFYHSLTTAIQLKNKWSNEKNFMHILLLLIIITRVNFVVV